MQFQEQRRNFTHWVLWDGSCAFCRRAARWTQHRDHGHRFHFVAYQEAPSPPMNPSLYNACRDAVHVVTSNGSVLRAGRACLFIMDGIGWKRLARCLSMPPWIWFVELGYRMVAGHRSFFSRLFFRDDGHADPRL